MRIGLFISDVSGEQTTIDELLANARAAEALGLLHRLGAAHPVEPRRPDRARARRPGHQPDRARHRGDAHLPAPPAGDGAAGDVDPGRDRRPPGARHRAVAPGGHREHARPRVRRVPPTTRASTWRCCGLRSRVAGHVEYRGEFFGFSSMLTVPGSTPAPIMVAALAPQDAEARGRAHRRHHHVLGQRACGRRAHRARASPPPPTPPERPPPRVVVGLPVGGVRRRRRRT